MIFRSYFKKQATLIRNSYTNSSRNPVVELSYGGTTNSATTYVSRYLLNIDLDYLKSKITSNTINQSTIQSHILKIKNCIALNDGYIGLDFVTSKRASGFDLAFIKIDESFDEGTGYDYIYNDNQYREVELNKSAANWYNRKNPQITWSQSGVFTGTTNDLSASTILTTQRFEIGNEDIEVDITEYVNGILFSGQTNNGICIAYLANTEILTSDTKNVTTFFSKYTQTFFEPFLETSYNDRVNDDLCCMNFDIENDFYFVSQAAISDMLKFEIIDSNDDIIYTTTTGFTQLNNFNYKTSYNIDSEIYQDKEIFTYRWYYVQNSKYKILEKQFNISKIDLNDGTSLTYGTEVFINVLGIKSNEIITKKVGIKRLIFKAKRLIETRILKNIIGDIEFRIYVNQGKNQIDVIPFTKASKVNDEYFTEIDFSWFISHDYTIEIRGLDKNGVQYPNTNYVKFRVTN
jgi:hypothetical protein